MTPTARTNLELGKPITLPCGLTLPNRLVKAAMSEEMGHGDLLPDDAIFALYRRWAEGGWGMMLTGALHVDATYIGSPHALTIDASLPAEKIHSAFSSWAAACKGDGPSRPAPAILQINHPGRQSPAGAGKRSFVSKSIAPSAVPMNLGPGLIARAANRLVFGVPRAMTPAEITAVVSQFARAARTAANAGFDGVEIHAAHGYLLAQFLSPESNLRTDEYGGTPARRARIVVEVVRAIRDAVSHRRDFAVGIKLNSVDHQSTAELDACVEQLRLIVEAGVDFIEISGGTYENPTMSTGPPPEKSERTRAREAFFLEFAAVIRREFPSVPLIVTGGFRTRNGMEAAVVGGDCDMVGLGRPAVLNPLLPQTIMFNSEVRDEDATLFVKKLATPWWLKLLGIRAIGAGIESMWYSGQMKTLAKGIAVK